MEKPPDLTGCGVCAYIEVFGGSTQEQITNTPADEARGEAVAVQAVERAQGVRAYLLSRDSMFFSWDNSRFQAGRNSIPD